MEDFPYFADPLHFAHLADPGTPCDLCGDIGAVFDAQGFYGTQPLHAICSACLKGGRLADVGASTNEVAMAELVRLLGSEERAHELRVEIECRTPALPTWQDRRWPLVGGEFPRFIKIASRPDCIDPEDLLASIPEEFRFGHDAQGLWDMLPEAPITSIADGNYDTSFYLFSSSKGKLCTWDSN